MISKFSIVEANIENAENLAYIVRESNKDVAKLFNLDLRKAPNHPSFCQSGWIREGMKRGETYFLYKNGSTNLGCVAFEIGDHKTSYLNRLSVLPEYRNRGVGDQLVRFIIDLSRKNKLTRVSIGMIAEYKKLKRFYLNIGFKEGEIKKFDHLPFNVQYLYYEL